MTRFCYRKPHFPPRAFVACLMFEKDGEFVSLYPVTNIYASQAEFLYDLKLLFTTNPHLLESISDTVIALPIMFQRLWPLKKEYWDTPDIKFSAIARHQQFLNMIGKHQFYHLLATPNSFTKPYTQTSAVCPFLANSSDKTIETFMKTSNYPVPPSASHAAVYSFEEDYGINWKTGKNIKRDRLAELQRNRGSSME